MSYKGLAEPKTKQDKALSRKHLVASVNFNMAHAKDHIKAAKVAKKELKARVKIAKKGSK